MHPTQLRAGKPPASVNCLEAARRPIEASAVRQEVVGQAFHRGAGIFKRSSVNAGRDLGDGNSLACVVDNVDPFVTRGHDVLRIREGGTSQDGTNDHPPSASKPAYRVIGRGWYMHTGWREATHRAVLGADRSVGFRPCHVVHGANVAARRGDFFM